eukprot:6131185-Prymnesium_polylepis.1
MAIGAVHGWPIAMGRLNSDSVCASLWTVLCGATARAAMVSRAFPLPGALGAPGNRGHAHFPKDTIVCFPEHEEHTLLRLGLVVESGVRAGLHRLAFGFAFWFSFWLCPSGQLYVCTQTFTYDIALPLPLPG